MGFLFESLYREEELQSAVPKVLERVQSEHYLPLETGNGNTPFSLSKHWICLCKPACPGLAAPETPQKGERI